MPRSPRIEYEGAVYHVMCRGNRREAIFQDDVDRESFLGLLGEACERTGWIVHSYVLMPNHYHWLLETPEANLSNGMRWFQGTYARRYCARHRVVGHVFQGRFKSPPIDPDDHEQFQVVSDYIHLNPARARMLPVRDRSVRLRDYRWSSFPQFLKVPSKRPKWLEFGRVAGNLGYDGETPQVRRRYGAYLQGRAQACHAGRMSKAEKAEWKQVRSGWYLGSTSFRDTLLERIPAILESKNAESFGGRVIKEHNERQARALIAAAIPVVGMGSLDELRDLRKSDPRKQAVVWLIKTHTAMPDRWVADILNAGTRPMLYHAVQRYRTPSRRTDKRLRRDLEKLSI